MFFNRFVKVKFALIYKKRSWIGKDEYYIITQIYTNKFEVKYQFISKTLFVFSNMSKTWKYIKKKLHEPWTLWNNGNMIKILALNI